jgi:hypothetical protein
MATGQVQRLDMGNLDFRMKLIFEAEGQFCWIGHVHDRNNKRTAIVGSMFFRAVEIAKVKDYRNSFRISRL